MGRRGKEGRGAKEMEGNPIIKWRESGRRVKKGVGGKGKAKGIEGRGKRREEREAEKGVRGGVRVEFGNWKRAIDVKTVLPFIHLFPSFFLPSLAICPFLPCYSFLSPAMPQRGPLKSC